MMKKKILCLTAIFLLFAACDKGCKIKRPKDVKPIDWGSYNDVRTVYWNTRNLCSESINCQSDTIRISGWKAWSYDSFNLCDDAKYADRSLGHTAAFPFVSIRCYLPEFKTKMDTSDLTKKCFIKGIIHLNQGMSYPRGNCCLTWAVIEITNIDDIYFK
jgi:hypothetical protein